MEGGEWRGRWTRGTTTTRAVVIGGGREGAGRATGPLRWRRLSSRMRSWWPTSGRSRTSDALLPSSSRPPRLRRGRGGTVGYSYSSSWRRQTSSAGIRLRPPSSSSYHRATALGMTRRRPCERSCCLPNWTMQTLENEIYAAAASIESFDSTFIHCGYRWV